MDNFAGMFCDLLQLDFISIIMCSAITKDGQIVNFLPDAGFRYPESEVWKRSSED